MTFNLTLQFRHTWSEIEVRGVDDFSQHSVCVCLEIYSLFNMRSLMVFVLFKV